jgi:O-antigen/teichoic acid export membrane protein
LEKEEIRTHYSGAILFAAKLISVATGIIFTLTVANSLSQPDYGAYGAFVNVIIPYFTILSGPIAFWSMRFAARDKKGAIKTGIVGNLAVSAIATLVYFAALPLVTASEGLDKYVLVYLVAAAMIIETYLITVFEAGLQAKRPHFVGYGLLVGEVLKVLFVYFFIARLQLALLGAILSLILAFAIKIAFYFETVWKELKQKISLGYIREWLKGSTFNLYNIAGDRLAALVFIMLIIYGKTIGYSYYFASVQIANIIAYSSFLAFALTPKLLADPNIDEATASLKNVLLFAVPMTAGVIAIPSSFLAFLKESGEYTVAAPVLVILAIDALVSTISTIFLYVLYGIEKVDEKAEIPFKQVLKSRIFIAFSLPYVHSAISLPIAFYALTNLAGNNPVLVATYVTVITLVARSATFAILYRVLRKDVKVKIPWKRIGKYVAASSVMALVLFFAHPVRRSSTLLFTGIGGLIYIVLLMAIDKETRTLARTIVQVVSKRMRTLARKIVQVVSKRINRPRLQ